LYFFRNFKSDIAKTELGSSMLSVFEELKARYESMREKLVMGIPLDSLPPLSVESKLLSVFSSYVPSKPHHHRFIHLHIHQVIYAIMCQHCPSAMYIGQTGQSLRKRINGHKSDIRNGNIQKPVGEHFNLPGHTIADLKVAILQQKKLQDCRKNQEINEDWFDAKENFTVTDFSVTLQGNEKEQENLEKSTKSEPNKHYFIHVGGLSPSVSEDDLRSHFQKYQVLEVSICEFSSNYRYASLSFKKASKAKLAVEEMNGKEIKGKAVNVGLVKTAGENILPASQKVSRPLHYENQAIDTLEKNIQVRTTCPVLDSLKVPSTISTSLKNPLQIKSVQFSPNPSATFIPPNTLNLSSFTKLMKKLKELHPKASSDSIVDALLKVRTNNKGFLSGLSINAIVEMASFILRQSASSCEKK
uniref:RRM domain-containing protein n=1 Tax=Chelydra serpentina TaxID=8475 RepID=A0A8C3S145_CHESE